MGDDTPLLSVVTAVWNEQAHTRRFVESVRRHTDVPYELIGVDNGSEEETSRYLDDAVDAVVHLESNLGFAVAMNRGLEKARGEFVAFCNNDTEVPEQWASRLVEHLRKDGVGIVVPAVTNALRKRNVRATPGDTVETLDPFESPPAAVIYLMKTSTARELGGFSEDYELASGEDTDLAFTVWVNGLDFVYDTRVLVAHASKGTARNIDWPELWKQNRDAFLDKWTSAQPDVPRLERCSPDLFAYRLRVARSVAGWMRSYFRTRDKLTALRAQKEQRRLPRLQRVASRVRSRRA